MAKKIVVIGAGPAGMMASIAAADAGAHVTLIERNVRPGRKLAITGKGRCNVTNACEMREFLTHVTSDPRFLYSTLSAFSCADVMQFVEGIGVPLKVERGARVFPVSDRAQDVVDAFCSEMRRRSVLLVCDRATALEYNSEGRPSAVVCEAGKYPCDAVIVATGGCSYPLTGSTGDGYTFARAAGHTVIAPRPSLVPLASPDKFCADCMGLSLRNVRVVLFCDDKVIYSDFGEMLFTHFGLSGPCILSASTRMEKKGRYRVIIDLKPALSDAQLDARILREINENPRRELHGLLRTLVPGKMLDPFIVRFGFDGSKRSAELSRADRDRIIRALRNLEIPISGMRPIDEAIVTAGGVSTREIDPKTMQSRKISGLYFAGEVMDVSAETGGYNLQIAFATGRAAGIAAAGE